MKCFSCNSCKDFLQIHHILGVKFTRMKYFHTPQNILLAASDLAQAAQFADAVIATVNYRDSNQANVVKIQDDHYISKLGETAVRKAFEQYDCRVEGPDYTIYEGKQKSWDDDLYINGVGLAVKTQRLSAAQRYGLSWTFQRSPARTDPILRKPEAWVCFVSYDDLSAQSICQVFPPLQISILPFKSPQLPHLAGKKVAVYAADIGFAE